MRKSLGTLALLLIVIGFIGVKRDWFTVEREREGVTTEVRVKINRDKIRTDTQHAAEIAREVGDNIEKKIDERQEVSTLPATSGRN